MAKKKEFSWKSLVRGPIPYIAAGVLVVVVGLSLLNLGGYRSISTQEGLGEPGQPGAVLLRGAPWG